MSVVLNKIESNSQESLQREFAPIVERIARITGNQLGHKQMSQIKSRIYQRIRILDLTTAKSYAQYFDRNIASESKALISILTTHYTYFFREFDHFEFLIKSLPQIVKKAQEEGRKLITIWSAAGSTGQEAFSLAMVLKFHLRRIDPSMSFNVLGTDIDSESVEHAKNGVFKWEELKKAPALFIANDWSRGAGNISEFVKAKDSLREYLNFEVRNLVELPKNQGGEKFDIIFCRNVFIYFPHETVEKVVNSLLERLHPGGFLISGLSESLSDISAPLISHGKCIYSIDSEVGNNSQPRKSARRTKLVAVPLPDEKKLTRVLVVDDSRSILAIMKKILSHQAGFEVVGTAMNGLEATEFLKSNEVDVVTLDIHMPKQNGVEYLKSSFRAGHPPVVIVSSVSREDAGLAIKALKYGAFDYIEKPSLGNLVEIESEITTKLNSAVNLGQATYTPSHGISSDFTRQSVIVNPELKTRNMFAAVSDIKHVVSVLNQTKKKHPPTILYITQPGNILEALTAEIQSSVTMDVQLLAYDSVSSLKLNTVYVDDVRNLKINSRTEKDFTVSNLLFGGISKNFLLHIQKYESGGLIVEDLGKGSSIEISDLQPEKDRFVPYTSFSYESDSVLSRFKKKRES